MLTHSFSHPFDIAEAHKVAERAFAFYQKRYPQYKITLRWNAPDQAQISFVAKGVSLSGSIFLEPKIMHLKLSVPFLLRMFQQQAIRIINEEMKHWFSETG